MPELIEHIDKIARDKKRDVLFLTFHDHAFKEALENLSEGDIGDFPDFDYHTCKPRQIVMEWLTANNIPFSPCGHVANVYSIMCYLGQIYIDVPFDENNPTYQKVRDFLENPDGTMKIDGARFCYYTLELAMKNAHHDEPGFWEKWAEKF